MKVRFSAALLGLALPALAGAQTTPPQATDPCTQMFIYAVQQFCSLMPNGQTLCQPVALAGPGPTCQLPAPGRFQPLAIAPASVTPPAAPSPLSPWPWPNAAAPSRPGMPGWNWPGTAPFAGMPAPQTPPGTAAAQAASLAAALPDGRATASAASTEPVNATPAPEAADLAPAPVAAPSPEPAPQVLALAAPEPEPTPVALTAPEPAGATPAPEPEPAPVALAGGEPPAPATPAMPNLAATTVPAASASKSVEISDALTHFAFDSVALSPAGKAVLDTWLAQAPVGMPVRVIGHADRLGSEAYNLRLSQRRADAVRDHLISRGKDARDIRTEARGEAEPVKHCPGASTPATKACLAPNRRVHVTHD